MYSCPVCGADDVARQPTCACGADLSLLQRLDAVADVWFNRGLGALAEGALGRALEWICACCAARPTDAAARLAQGKMWAQLGRWEEARDALDRVASIDPTLPELAGLYDALRGAGEKAGPEVPSTRSAAGPAAARAMRPHRRAAGTERATGKKKDTAGQKGKKGV